MKIPNKLINFLLKKKISVLLPKRIIRLIIKKNRVFFLKTTLFKLPKNNFGEMAEWFKAHAWKVCVPSQVPWVRIPLSPPEVL